MGEAKRKGTKLQDRFQSDVDWKMDGTVEEMWNTIALKIRECFREVLGVTVEGKTRVNKETQWWKDEVQEAVREKMNACKLWKEDKADKTKLKDYRRIKGKTKIVVAKVKASKYDDVFKKLGTKKEEKNIYWIARERRKQRMDIQRVKCIKDEDGRVLVEDNEINKKLEEYFSMLLNEGVEDCKDGSGVREIEVDG